MIHLVSVNICPNKGIDDQSSATEEMTGLAIWRLGVSLLLLKTLGASISPY